MELSENIIFQIFDYVGLGILVNLYEDSMLKSFILRYFKEFKENYNDTCAGFMLMHKTTYFGVEAFIEVPIYFKLKGIDQDEDIFEFTHIEKEHLHENILKNIRITIDGKKFVYNSLENKSLKVNDVEYTYPDGYESETDDEEVEEKVIIDNITLEYLNSFVYSFRETDKVYRSEIFNDFVCFDNQQMFMNKIEIKKKIWINNAMPSDIDSDIYHFYETDLDQISGEYYYETDKGKKGIRCTTHVTNYSGLCLEDFKIRI